MSYLYCSFVVFIITIPFFSSSDLLLLLSFSKLTGHNKHRRCGVHCLPLSRKEKNARFYNARHFQLVLISLRKATFASKTGLK